MQKKISIKVFLTVVVAMVAVFAYTEVMAADCSVAPDPPGTCWEFVNLKHKIEFLGTFDVDGLTEFRYKVTRTGKINLNHWNFGIPVCKSGCIEIKQAFPDANQYPPCIGDPATDVGVGDCEHCWTRLQRNLTKDEPEIWYFRVSPPVKINTVPVHLKSGNDYEFGSILGPACVLAEYIEETVSATEDAQGNTMVFYVDREGKVTKVEKCDPGIPPGDPTCADITGTSIELEQMYACIPPDPDGGHPANADLDLDGVEDHHCGSFIYIDDWATLSAEANLTCRCYRGRCVCY